jgi:hypothetical protein
MILLVKKMVSSDTLIVLHKEQVEKRSVGWVRHW